MVDKEKVKCDVCGKLFSSQKQMEQHRHDTHKIENKVRKASFKKSSYFKLSKKLIIVIAAAILVAIIGIAVAYSAVRSYNISATLSALTIDGIQCNTLEQTLFHRHVHLDIFINGQPYAVPSQIGILPEHKCLYWLHTHDDSGIIHIESPVNRDYTLGQFVDIWNKKLANTPPQILNNSNKTSDGGKTTFSVYVNGSKVNDVSYKDIKLNPHDEIVLVYGTPPSRIPSNYTFENGL